MQALIGGLGVGLALGALMSRETICFNAGLRRAAFERRWRILRIFAIAVAAQLLLLPLLIGFDATLFSSPDELPAIGLFPISQVLGGLLFGAGMALAGGCITGILWKSGAGSIATAIAIGGFVAGELLIRGPLEDLLTELDGAVEPPADQTLYGLFGVGYVPLALILGVVALALLWRGSRRVLLAGLLLALIGAAAWLAAGWAGYGYGLGFVGAAENAQLSIEAGDPGMLSFAFFLAVGVIAGGAAATRGPLRRPDRARALRAATGGLAMGVGGSLAHGCNIGNGLTGIPLLSLGSILATTMMALGAVATWRFALSPSTRLRGTETPEPNW